MVRGLRYTWIWHLDNKLCECAPVSEDTLKRDDFSKVRLFDGYFEFPPSRMDLTQGDYFYEEKEEA